MDANSDDIQYMYDSLTRNKCELNDYHWNVRDKDPSFEVNEQYFLAIYFEKISKGTRTL